MQSALSGYAYSYNADGLRVQQASSAGTTNYTLDPDSGFGNVIEERDGSATFLARYDYGDDLIDMQRGGVTSWYLFDGHGSTRQLTDDTGNVTDTYSYDAYGNLIAHTGTTVNPYLYDAQCQDATGLYYLRARYMDPTRGEFESQDPYDGNNEDPATLHRYIFVDDDPINYNDSTGEYTSTFGLGIEPYIHARYIKDHPGNSVTFGSWQYFDLDGWIPFTPGVKRGTYLSLKPDIFDMTSFEFGEIKPFTLSGVTAGFAKIDLDDVAYGPRWWSGGNPNGSFAPTAWSPEPSVIMYGGSGYYIFNVAGVIFYSSSKTDLQAAAEAVELGLSQVVLKAMLKTIATEGTGQALTRSLELARTGVQASVAAEEEEDVAVVETELIAA